MIGVSVFITALIVALIAWTRKAQKSVATDIAAVHMLGFPTTRAELDALEPRTGPDASPLLGEFRTEQIGIAETSNLKFLMDGYHDNIDPVYLERAADRFRPRLKPLLDASKLKWWSYGFAGPSAQAASAELQDHEKDFTFLQNWAWLLTAMANADSQVGKLDQALIELKAIEGLEYLAGQKADGESGVAALQIDRILIGELHRLMKNSHGDPKAMRVASEVLASMPPLPNIKRVFEDGFVATAEFFVLKAPNSNRSAFVRLKKGLYDKPRASHTFARDLHDYRLSFASLPRNSTDYDGMRSVFQEVARQDPPDAISKSFRADMFKDEKSPFPSEMASDAYICDSWVQAIARRRLVNLGWRLIHDHATGKPFPLTLPDIGPARIDPFSHRPFIYKPSAGGFLVYSLGRNRRDDGGTIGRTSDEGDIIFRYPTASLRAAASQTGLKLPQ